MDIYSFVSTPTRLEQPCISMPSFLDLLYKVKNKSNDFVFAYYERVPVYYDQHFCNISGEGYFRSVTLEMGQRYDQITVSFCERKTMSLDVVPLLYYCLRSTTKQNTTPSLKSD